MTHDRFGAATTAYAAHASDHLQRRIQQIALQAAYGLFVITCILSTCAVKLGVGTIPYRMVTLLTSGALIAAADLPTVLQAFRDTVRLLAIILCAAVLALVVSLVAHNPPASVVRQIVEIHMQASVGVIVSYSLMLRFGVPRILCAFLIGYGISSVIAIAQWFGVDAAWDLRRALGSSGSDTLFDIVAINPNFEPTSRATGLAYTPVIFATHTCIALACAFYIRVWQGALRAGAIDLPFLGIALVLFALCVMTGNRSPALGLGIFLLVFLVARMPKLIGIILPMALLITGVLLVSAPLLERTGLRVARTNSSSENRSTLRAYGAFLVERRPLGYGLTFDSTVKSNLFIDESKYMANPLAIRRWALHNYYLTMLTKYGVLILFIVPLVLPRRRDHILLWLPFIPYMVHIFYHNDGPLQGDFLVFYAFAAATALLRRPDLFRGASPRRRSNPWRRAFTVSGSVPA